MPIKIQVGKNEKFEKTPKSKIRVVIVGPIDRRTCAICFRFVGKTFKFTDPSIQMFIDGAGAHPRCRHSADILFPRETPEQSKLRGRTPAGVPQEAEDAEEFVDFFLDAENTKRLNDIYGQKRTEILIKGKAELDDLYNRDNTLKTLDQLEKSLKLKRRRKAKKIKAKAKPKTKEKKKKKPKKIRPKKKGRK